MNSFQKQSVSYYALIFVPLESKLSFLKNSRKYKVLEDLIINCLIDIFNDDKFKEEHLDYLLNKIVEYQDYYFKILNKQLDIPAESEKEFSFIKRQPLKNRLLESRKLLNKLDKTNCGFIENIKRENTNIELDIKEEKISNIFKDYAEGLAEYSKIMRNYKIKPEDERNKMNLHTSDTFINEFHQFFTQYSYANVAWSKQEQDKHSEFTVFINENINRAIKHLERAVLDIYKIITTLRIRNETGFLKDNFDKILETRNFEICNISNSIEKKTAKFKQMLK